MSLRPGYARWFELLTTREDLTRTLETLASTGCIELETHSETHPEIDLQNLQTRLQSFDQLARRYQPYWPHGRLHPASVGGKPSRVLETALERLLRWEQAALPFIQTIEALVSEQTSLQLLEEFLSACNDEWNDIGLLKDRDSGTSLVAGIFVLSSDTPPERIPDRLLLTRLSSDNHHFLLAVGLGGDLATLANELANLKATALVVPDWLHGTRSDALQAIGQRIEDNSLRLKQQHQAIEGLIAPYFLREALGDIHRLEWFLSHVHTLPVSRNFAWITGWTSDAGGQRLQETLREARVNAVIHFPDAPDDLDPPVLMRNPWWAQPFELFANMLGTPAHNEADPSRLLALLAPLLFGYMFGDVGQGFVLLLAGLVLQRRWPLLRILVANGFAAIVFGFIFGSVFGREDILPALWVHPVENPLPVLLVPLAGGIFIITLGLLLNAVGAYWRGGIRRWLRLDAPVALLYLSLVASLFTAQAGLVAAAALAWYFAGTLLQADSSAPKALASAIGSLLENILQLLINSVSFVRVGAFALAHGGLSLAFNIMADAGDSLFVSLLIILLGNLVVIALEGLVVSIQTTRLILFEFFIRFLTGSGRSFRPLSAPTTELGTGRTT